MAYSKNKQIFDSPLDDGGPYLAMDPGSMARGATSYWQAYGTSFRFDHCLFTTVTNESSQNNSFQIYDPFQKAWDATEVVNQAQVQYPAESRVIRIEMFPFFGPAVDPTCSRYGYDCPEPDNYFQLWGNVGGSVIFDDGHAKSIVACGIYDQEYVTPDAHRSNDSTTDPNAWTGTWYSLCD